MTKTVKGGVVCVNVKPHNKLAVKPGQSTRKWSTDLWWLMVDTIHASSHKSATGGVEESRKGLLCGSV